MILDSLTLELKGLSKILGPSLLYFLNLMYGYFVLANMFGCVLYWVADLEGMDSSWIADHLKGNP